MFTNEHSVLRLEPNDKDALKTKLFLLLQTEQYDAALALIDGGDQAATKFEKSYTLYRMHREPEARVVLGELRSQQSDHRGALHLEAQLVRLLPAYSMQASDESLVTELPRR